MPSSELFSGPNAGYVEELFQRYLADPDSVSAHWGSVFSKEASERGLAPTAAPEPARPAAPSRRPRRGSESAAAMDAVSGAAPPTAPAPQRSATLRAMQELLHLVARATSLVQAFRDHGHQLARIDPLGSDPPGHPQLDPSFFGTSMEQLEALPASTVFGDDGDERVPDYLKRLERAYCGSIGYQFEHLESPERVRWLWNQVESGAHAQRLTREEQVELLTRLARVEGLEQFLHRVYPGQVRFSLEGNDMLVPMVDLVLEVAAARGCREVVMGMAHRGRLNVLAHSVGVGYDEILRQFEGAAPAADGILTLPDDESGIGDVKYHHGATRDHVLRDGSSVRVTLLPNPSHLEFVNPVVAGLARARQFAGPRQDDAQDTAAVVPLLIHGDAAFAAEGVVAESLNLARLAGYATGGVVHLIVNNQIGFTTDPEQGRSTRYASDLAKGYDIPVLRVNADDPPACLTAMRLAMAYRAEFHDDIVVDLIGYRRHGHNEGDDPAYTQPRLYQRIRAHPTVFTLYAEALVKASVVTADEVAAARSGTTDRLRQALVAASAAKPSAEAGNAGAGSSKASAKDAVGPHGESVAEDAAGPDGEVVEEADGDPTEAWDQDVRPTAVTFATLAEINAASMAVPEDFSVNPKLGRQLDRSRSGFTAESSLDWAHAEALALGSLLREGIPIRFSGQDVQRGTFSHRHLVFHDAESGSAHAPLAAMGGGRFEIHNSPLSETAVLGFEYGYSVGADRDLVIWEAQFGDFANVAQPIIDQFVASGQSKWGQLSRLVMLLPHGYEGRGPEHSSARLERFLQMCAAGNMRIANPTTSAQYFHLLRHQAHTPERPLVVLTPKSLLRHKLARSQASELTGGGFQPVLAEDVGDEARASAARLILCSGKVYYDLLASEERANAKDAVLARVEQLYPFPRREIAELLAGLPALREVVWTQEEPRNMGARPHVAPLLRALMPETLTLRQASRPEWSSPAEGKLSDHLKGQRRIIGEAFAA
ncbi:MAG: 2-oxoglutarate dehydrogenase E1 component [Gammaproteobacteria bacterium]|nr:2-oxoglutarate dehydrogenase E1 component [Gammaproteobacteria bacterium]